MKFVTGIYRYGLGPGETPKTLETPAKGRYLLTDLVGQPAREALGETRRRCTATNRGGERCKRPPIIGGFVCDMHGGKAPAVKAMADRRLLAMVDPALSVLFRAVQQSPPCAHCGRSDADRDPVALRAAGMILDRAGFHPTLAIKAETQPSQPTADLDWMAPERMQQVATWVKEAREAMECGDPKPGDADAIDAELVEPQG